METKEITCPQCKGRLEITNPRNEPVLFITCPNPACKAKMRVAFDMGKTFLTSKKKNEDAPGYLEYKGAKFNLNEGRNTVGRTCLKHIAQIELPTDDMTMSREHCMIEVTRLANGRMKAVISDMRSIEKIKKKPTVIENMCLEKDDRIVMTDGDLVKMGEQLLRYYQ